jgi:Zn-dependent protease
MGAKFEIGRIAGLPVMIDISFIILIVLWGERYFTSGNSVDMSIGFLLVVGLAVSILIHELAHAIVGHKLGWAPSHVELNGLGGLCYWASTGRSLAWQRIAVSLAGPFSNLALYFLFTQLAQLPGVSTNRLVLIVALNLAWANWWMFLFNLLPAFPLDGGKALEALLGKVLTFLTARRIVGALGLCVAAYCAYLGLSGNTWMLILAVMLGLENYEAVQGASNPPWQRRN